MKVKAAWTTSSPAAARATATLMAMLAQRLSRWVAKLAASEEFGLPAEAKEAAAFALLAWQTWHHLPGNVPASNRRGATGDSGAGDVCVAQLRGFPP
jgi:1,6-anhydro-N-acetylmuramate kinase